MIVLITNGEDGVRCFGPFESHEEAAEFGQVLSPETTCGEFWTSEIEKVEA
jgi:hypothetical protein